MMKTTQTNVQKKPEVMKPFLTGTPTDCHTARSSLKFCGILILVFFVTFITCSSISSAGTVIRIIFSTVVIILILFVFFNYGANLGADAVAKGEILYQKQQEGKICSESEKKQCFHPLKAYIIGFIGTVPFLLIAAIFAFNATITQTGAGTLPSWMQAYIRRTDIANALISYVQPDGATLTDYMRIAVRIFILPFVNLIGIQNPHGLLVLERISPLLLLLPALSYGTGYLNGRNIRTKVHTMISENNRKRKKKEINARKKRTGSSLRSGPEQLN